MEALNYDDDGNLLQDGRWTYSYDAGNQLIRMETRSDIRSLLSSVPGGEQPLALDFVYDYQGRRVSKKVHTWNGSAWVLSSERRYVYQGWNLIAELDSAGSVLRQFFWGLDVTHTLTGAGGVGALLMIQDGANTYLPAYDGNGNLTALTDAGGTIVASYEYSPFGELLRVEGSYAMSNPFRWSTKWTDDETGLVYYGLRYFSPRLGRFVNRDPIGEQGGAKPVWLLRQQRHQCLGSARPELRP